MTIEAIVTDIEGTTSSIDFVHDVLFPYASQQLPEFVRNSQADPEVATALDAVRNEAGEADADIERVIAILLQWIDEDRKATALKSLQGLIWKHGYVSGGFTGHMYDDAVRKLRAWSAAGIDLYVYSSGSVGAQKLLFGHSDAGDLQPLFRGYFDTNIGHKRDADSYRNIIETIDVVAAKILFLSDVAEELDAATTAGMQTFQLVRDEKVVPGKHRIAHDFDEVLLD
jgi:enolase-phosphatase E1